MRLRTIAYLFDHFSRRHARTLKTKGPASARPAAEAVERRVLLASFAPYVSGTAAVEDGTAYRLNLFNSGTEAVTSWRIN
jgi:hypothetical protein